MDFLVVIAGWISKNINAGNFSSVRILRVLRPLRTINSLQGMKKIVMSIFASLPSMFNIFILSVFFYVMFGAFGLNIFMGTFKFRCFNGIEVQYDDDGYQMFCNPGVLNDVCAEGFVCVHAWNPNFGITSFDTIFDAFIQIFVIITLEGWTDIMYIARKANGTKIYDLYFVLVVIFGTFFVLNLMIAVQSSFLSEAFQDLGQNLQDEKKPKEKDTKELENNEHSSDDQLKAEGRTEPALGRARSDSVGNIFQIDQPNQQISSEPVEKEDKVDESVSEPKRKKLKCCKCFLEFQVKVRKVIESRPFNIFILILILINTLFLSLVYYNMPEKLNTALKYGNIALTLLFAIEIILKMIGLGIVTFFKDGFNIFDLVVVALGLLDFVNSINTKAFTAFRTAKLLRILKLVRSWTSLRRIILLMLKSLSSLWNLGMLMGLFCFIYALMGYQLFYGVQVETSGEETRYVYDSFGQTMITIFVLLTGSNFNSIVYNAIAQHGYVSCIFFMTNILFGNMMLLNMFLAVFLNFVSNNLEENEGEENAPTEQKNDNAQQEEVVMHISYSPSLNKPQSQKYETQQLSFLNIEELKKNNGQLEEEKNENGPLEEEQKEDLPNEFPSLFLRQQSSKSFKKRKQLKQSYTKLLKGKSLFILSPESKIRNRIKSFVEHQYFEDFIYHAIAFNCLLLALHEPIIFQKFQIKSNDLMQDVMSGIFLFECVLKIVVMGFVGSPTSYLRDSFNKLDFFIVICTILNWILQVVSSKSISYIKAVRALRALRPLKMIQQNPGMKVVVSALLISIPGILNVMMICIFCYFIFGILGVQLFLGGFNACSDPLMYSFSNSPHRNQKSLCSGLFYDQTLGQLAEREWVTPFNTFDNVIYAIVTLFQVSSQENWTDVMYTAIDSNGTDWGPVKNNSPSYSLIFIVFQVITSFFVMHLFVSVVVDKINEEVKQNNELKSFSEEQKIWVQIQKHLLALDPKQICLAPRNKCRRFFFRIVKSKKFELFIIFVIAVNTITLIITYDGQTDDFANILNTCNLVFLGIFTLEALFKLFGFGVKFYFRQYWNIFDFIIIILSYFAIFATNLAINFTPLRVIRAARLLRMIKASSGIKKLLKTLFLALANILNVALLLCLILFIFSIGAMQLYGNMDFGNNITKEANFNTFYLSFITLFRMMTGENWNYFMIDCYNVNGSLSIVYWIFFIVIARFIFVELFTAVIFEAFVEISNKEDEVTHLNLSTTHIKQFLKFWSMFAINGDLYMKTSRFQGFLRELPPPLGYSGMKLEGEQLRRIIYCLNIRDHKGKVYFPEVLWAIFHSILGSNDENLVNSPQIQNIMRQIRMKYSELPRNTTFNSLCGNKFLKQKLTVSKYLAAMNILRHLQMHQKRQIMLRALPKSNSEGKQEAIDNKYQRRPSKSKLQDRKNLQQEQTDQKLFVSSRGPFFNGPYTEAVFVQSPVPLLHQRLAFTQKEVQEFDLEIDSDPELDKKLKNELKEKKVKPPNLNLI